MLNENQIDGWIHKQTDGQTDRQTEITDKTEDTTANDRRTDRQTDLIIFSRYSSQKCNCKDFFKIICVKLFNEGLIFNHSEK